MVAAIAYAVIVLQGGVLTTSTRQVTGLASLPDGSLVVSTMGGAYRIDGSRRVASIPTETTEFRGISLEGRDARLMPSFGKVISLGKAKEIGQPVSDTKGLPPNASIRLGNWAGTFDRGLWRLEAGQWRPFPLPGSNLPSHNVVAFEDRFAFTLDGGVLERVGAGWKSVAGSPQRPRHAIRDGEGWILRDADSKLFRTDMNIRGALPIPAQRAPALLGQAGSLSLRLAPGWLDATNPILSRQAGELQKFVPTCALITESHVYIGTQEAGLARISRSTGDFEWVDRGVRLGDDWITSLSSNGREVAIGTFVGGLSILEPDAGRISSIAKLRGANVTTIVPTFDGWLAGTRQGLFHVQGQAARRLTLPQLPAEVQALQINQNLVTIGSRTGIFDVTTERLLQHKRDEE